MTFAGWIRPLESYMRAFEEAGFLIERLREPPVPHVLVDQDTSQQCWQRIPNFLQLRAVRIR